MPKITIGDIRMMLVERQGSLERAVVGLSKLHKNKDLLYRDIKDKVGIRFEDENFLLSIARQIMKGRGLSKKQAEIARDIIFKDTEHDLWYLNQLILIANKKIWIKSAIGQFLDNHLEY